MDKKKLLIIGGVVVGVIAVVGIIIALISRSIAPSTSSVTPTVAPGTQPSSAPISLSVKATDVSFVASQSGSLDLYLNTNGANIDGFQFIATLDGTSGPVITDGDPSTPGTQIDATIGNGLTVVTNSVTTENNAQIIRFSMVNQTPGTPFTSSTPTKVGTIRFMTAQAGTLGLTFNTQNTRARPTGSSEDSTIATSSQSYTVTGAVAAIASTPIPVATASASPTPTPLAKAKTTTTKTTALKSTPVLGCDNACLTDNDCSSGLSCVNNACRAPACTDSASCSCIGGTTSTTTTAAATSTPTPTPVATVNPYSSTSLATATPSPTAMAALAKTTSSSTATIAALPKSLPSSGSVEDTILLIAGGVICMGMAAFLMIW